MPSIKEIKKSKRSFNPEASWDDGVVKNVENPI